MKDGSFFRLFLYAVLLDVGIGVMIPAFCYKIQQKQRVFLLIFKRAKKKYRRKCQRFKRLRAVAAAAIKEVFEAKMKTKEEYLADFKKWGLLGGRPKSFKSPKDMAGKIAAWLADAEKRSKQIVTKSGAIVEVNMPAPVLIESFCKFCGITKTTFYEYASKPEYKALTDFVQQSSEEYLVRQCVEGPAGNKADFVLKNAFGGEWSDTKTLDFAKDIKQAMVEFVVDGTGAGADSGSVQTAVDSKQAN